MTIKRPVRKLNSEAQLEIFGPRPKESPPPRLTEAKKQRRSFVDPDPNEIFIGNERLRDFLLNMGQDEAILVRTVLREMDWEAFESKYSPRGRAPYAPASMVGIIVYGMMKGQTSLRQLENLARCDVGCMWVSGQIFPDHSILGRFINQHQETLTNTFFEALTTKILNVLGQSACHVLSGDGSLIEAYASAYQCLKLEAAELAAKEAREEYKKKTDRGIDDKALEQKAHHAENLAQIVQARAKKRQGRGASVKHTRVSPTEPEAVFHRLKQGTYRFAYLPSIVANEQRLIIAQTVHPKSETAVVKTQIDQARRVLKHPVKTLMYDGNYLAGGVLETALEENVDLLCPPPKKSTRRKKTKVFRKREFSYDAAKDVYICPASQVLSNRFGGYDKKVGQNYHAYATTACGTCPIKEQCTKSKRGRRIKRFASDDLKDAMRQVMCQTKPKQLYQRRQGMVEPIFGELKHSQNLKRFRRKGLKAVQLEFALHAMAHNLRRLCKLYSREALLKLIISLCMAIYKASNRSEVHPWPTKSSLKIC